MPSPFCWSTTCLFHPDGKLWSWQISIPFTAELVQSVASPGYPSLPPWKSSWFNQNDWLSPHSRHSFHDIFSQIHSPFTLFDIAKIDLKLILTKENIYERLVMCNLLSMFFFFLHGQSISEKFHFFFFSTWSKLDRKGINCFLTDWLVSLYGLHFKKVFGEGTKAEKPEGRCHYFFSMSRYYFMQRCTSFFFSCTLFYCHFVVKLLCFMQAMTLIMIVLLFNLWFFFFVDVQFVANFIEFGGTKLTCVK